MDLNTPVAALGRLFSMQRNKLAKLGIFTLRDLLYHIPSRYEDLRLISPIKNVQPGETVTIKGEVVEMKNEYRTRRLTIQKATVLDDTGKIECRWFNQPYLTRSILTGDTLSASGSADTYGKKLSLTVKEYEVIKPGEENTVSTGRLVPIYPLTAGLSSKWLRNRIYDLLFTQNLELTEYLPETLLLSHHLPDIKTAIAKIHFPDDFEQVASSHKRLSYEELFQVQLGGMVRRAAWEKKNKAPQFHILPHKTEIDKLFTSLPFTLTRAQTKALDEIFADLATPTPMNRLLEGDVGSGKTVVAAIALYVAVLNGFQGVLMAPTEILANQHFETVRNLLTPLGISVGLRTGSSKGKGEAGKMDILVGTHALLNAKIEFENLGLVVIDEQQRFGVEQRGVLRGKGASPHFLTMTATPIPRTIFLTLYGDLSLSLLDELPKGRVKIKTWLVPNEKRDAGYDWIKEKIVEVDEHGNRNQVFVICPFIEESESATTVKAATKEYERLSKEIFKDFRVGLLHGKMKGREKDAVLADFAEGKRDVLVATPVVEVGIDIPNATIMVIEASERFGLSQLHQLRGRVGRRQRESYCLLYTESATARERLKSLEKIYIGAELAELDLKLRGPGDMYGTAQHGGRMLKIASYTDAELIITSKKDAEKIFPSLKKYPDLQKYLDETLEAKKILPD